MPWERILRFSLTVLFLTTVIVVLPRRPINHVDFNVYVVASLAWLSGENIYSLSMETWRAVATSIGSPYVEPLPFFYSPVSLLVFLPFALLTRWLGFQTGALCWDVVKLVLLWCTLRMARRWTSLSRDWLLISTFLWLPLISDFSLGQINILILAIFAAALSLSQKWQGFLLGIGFHIKGLLLAPLAVLLGRGDTYAFLWGLGGLLVPASFFALIDPSLIWLYLTRRILPFAIATVQPLTEPDLVWLVHASHLRFPVAVRIVALIIGLGIALVVKEKRAGLVTITSTATLFSGVAERGHLLLLLPAVWLLLEAAQQGALPLWSRWLGVVGFVIFTLGNLSSLVTVDLPRIFGLPWALSPIETAAPFLSWGALLIWCALIIHLPQGIVREKNSWHDFLCS